jgi:hypothetical protein
MTTRSYCARDRFYIDLDCPNGNRARIFHISDLAYGYTHRQPDANAIEAYSHVATLDLPRPEPDSAFALLNRGSGEEHIALDAVPMRSLSVGDIVYLHDLFWFCAPLGWNRVIPSPLTQQLYELAVRHETEAAQHRTL